MPTRVKGAVLLARKAFAEATYGEQAWQRVLEALPQEDREALGRSILTADWYPFELNKRLDQAIVSSLGGGARQIFESIGAQSARENLLGPHTAFLTQGEPERFMGNTDRIYEFYYDTGSRDFESTGPSSGIMTTRDSDTFSETDCLTVVGWYKEALKLCGARDIEVKEELCRARGDEVCRYRVSWQI
jgi:uncharacterized protein (TIGR02265 family)